MRLSELPTVGMPPEQLRPHAMREAARLLAAWHLGADVKFVILRGDGTATLSLESGMSRGNGEFWRLVAPVADHVFNGADLPDDVAGSPVLADVSTWLAESRGEVERVAAMLLNKRSLSGAEIDFALAPKLVIED